MTTLSTFSRLATVAVAALLLAPIHAPKPRAAGGWPSAPSRPERTSPAQAPSSQPAITAAVRPPRGGPTPRPTATAPPSFVTIAGSRCRGRCRPTGTGTEARADDRRVR